MELRSDVVPKVSYPSVKGGEKTPFGCRLHDRQDVGSRTKRNVSYHDFRIPDRGKLPCTLYRRKGIRLCRIFFPPCHPGKSSSAADSDDVISLCPLLGT